MSTNDLTMYVMGRLSGLSLLILAVAAVVNVAAPKPPAQTASSAVAPAEFWRHGRWAPANALHVLLRAHGIESDYGALQGTCGVGRSSMTLEHLRSAGGALASHLLFRRPKPEELAGARFPLLAHLDPIDGDYRKGGRLVLVCRIDEATGHVVIYDSATLLQESLGMQDFLRLWSGAMIEVAPGHGVESVAAWIFFTLGIGTAVTGIARGRWSVC